MDTATRPVTTEPAFHSNDFEEAPEYSSVSALAIVSLLFGLASPLCLVSRFFLIIPVLGTVLSIFALARIAASAGALAGRWAAVVGLALCIVFGVAELSREAITRYLRTAEAKEIAQDWLGTLAGGKTEEAFHLTVEGQRPPPLPEPGVPPPTTNPFDEFKKLDVINDISSAGEDSKIDFEGTDDYQRLSWRQFIIRQRFQISPESVATASKPEPFEVLVTTQRSHFAGEHRSRWLIWKYETPTDGLP